MLWNTDRRESHELMLKVIWGSDQGRTFGQELEAAFRLDIYLVHGKTPYRHSYGPAREEGSLIRAVNNSFSHASLSWHQRTTPARTRRILGDPSCFLLVRVLSVLFIGTL